MLSRHGGRNFSHPMSIKDIGYFVLRSFTPTTLWSWFPPLGSPTRSTVAKNLSIFIVVTPEHSGSGSLAIDPFRINGAAHFARSHPMDGSLGSFIQLIFNQLGCSSSNYIQSCSVILRTTMLSHIQSFKILTDIIKLNNYKRPISLSQSTISRLKVKNLKRFPNLYFKEIKENI